MTETFTCPSCGAPQEVPKQPASTLRCPYCGHQVIIPEELRVEPEPDEEQPSTMVVDLTGVGNEPAAVSSRGRRWLGCLVIAVIGLLVIISLIPLLIIPLIVRQTTTQIESVIPQQIISTVFIPGFTPPPAATPTPGFATLALSFGGEGTGAGLFEDARTVGVDGEGRIYVGEYLGGRVQVFDPAGKFLTQWLVDGELPLLDMVVGRDGTVYIVQRGDIWLYDGMSGKLLGKYPDNEEDIDDMYLPLDGGLLAASTSFSDDILRFNREGELALTIPDAISGVTGDSELTMRVAEDGLGNLYALGGFNEAIFKYNPKGKFTNQFGSSGDEAGQFRALLDLAVDGQGRVYASDITGVQVFDGNGRYLALIEVDSPAFGLVIDEQGFLYVAARTNVYKYAVNR